MRINQPEIDEDVPLEQDIVLVMGLTGAGKSFFINKLTDQDVQIGHQLRSCRSSIANNKQGNGLTVLR
jgi:predicted GTPase